MAKYILNQTTAQLLLETVWRKPDKGGRLSQSWVTIMHIICLLCFFFICVISKILIPGVYKETTYYSLVATVKVTFHSFNTDFQNILGLILVVKSLMIVSTSHH